MQPTTSDSILQLDRKPLYKCALLRQAVTLARIPLGDGDLNKEDEPRLRHIGT